MKKIVLALFLLSISSNALAEELIMDCKHRTTFKYVKKLITKDRIYTSEKASWVEWCNGNYKAKKYNASCIDDEGYKHNLDFVLNQYHDGSAINFIVSSSNEFIESQKKGKTYSCRILNMNKQ